MNSNTTGGPRPITGSSIQAWGVPIEEWRSIAMQAQADVQRDPNDQEAARQLRMAQRALRVFQSQVVAPMMEGANQRDRANLRGETAASRTGNLQAGAVGVINSASLGLGDDIAGVAASVVPGGQTGQQARDRFRAGLSQVREDAPVGYWTGEVLGGVGLGAGAGRALAATGSQIAGVGRTVATSPARQAVGTALIRGGQTLGAGGTLTGNALGAAKVAGAVGGVEGALRGLASEGDLVDRLESAARMGAGGAVIGGTVAGVGQAGQRFLAARKAKRVKLDAESRSAAARAQLNEAAVTRIPLQQQIMEDRAVTAANQAQLTTQRVERGSRMRPANVSGGPAADTEAGIRARLRQQNFSDADIERVLAERRARMMPGAQAVQNAPESAPAPAGASTAPEPTPAAPLPPSTPEEGVMVRGRTGDMPAGNVVVNQVPESTRAFAQFVARPLNNQTMAQASRFLQTLDEAELAGFVNEIRNARQYGWLRDEWATFFDGLGLLGS